MYHTNTNQKQVGIAIFISDTADFRERKMVRDTEGHYIMIKGKPSLTCMCVTAKYKLCEAKTNRIVRRNRWIHSYNWRLQYPLSEMDKSSRQKISKDIIKFNNTINQLDIMGIYRLLYAAIEYTKMHHILGHKTYLTNLKE